MIDITLSAEQMAYALRKAEERQSNKERKGVRTRLVTKDISDLAVQKIGTIAEVAYCIYRGWDLTLIGGIYTWGDGGYDFIDGEQKIDVKGCRRRNYNLERNNFENPADLYVLMWPKSKMSVTIIGEISDLEFRDICKPVSNYPAYRVPWQKLTPINPGIQADTGVQMVMDIFRGEVVT